MFKLNLVTPEKKIVTDQELEEVTLPASRGELNILPGHAPLMTTLVPGRLRYRLKNGETGEFAISWGYAQVSSEGVSILAEHAVTAQDVDGKVIQDKLKTQEDRLMNETLEEPDYEKVQSEIGRLRAEMDLLSTRH